MPYDRERYPGLYSLRESLGRQKTKLPTPRPEGHTSLMDNARRSMMVDQNIDAAKRGLQERELMNKQIISGLVGMAGGRAGTPTTTVLPTTGMKASGNLGWGGKKAFGDMSRDEFVSLFGALGSAVAPDTPQGRIGGVLSQFGQQSMQRRRGREETLRKEAAGRRKRLTEAELGIGKEERGRLADIEKAKTLAETQKETASALAGTREKAAGMMAGAKVTAAGTLREHQKTMQTQKDVAAMARTKFAKSQKGAMGKAGLTPSQQINYKQEELKYIDTQMKTYSDSKEGLEATPEQSRLKRSSLIEQYRINTLPGYKPSKNTIVRSRETADGQMVYFNAYGHAYEDEAGKTPYKPTGQEGKRVKTFKINQ